MGINWGRVILGGLVAGLVVNVSEFAINNLWLDGEWTEAIESLNRSSAVGAGGTAAFWLWGFLTGIFALYLYAAFRPRFGAGPRTAVRAAVASWIPGSVLGLVFPAVLELFPVRLMAIGVISGLVEIVIGTLVGARLYQESETAKDVRAAVGRGV
jgi:hypothetical protein